MLGQVDDYAGWIVGVLGGITALGVIGRWLGKRMMRVARRVNNAADTLLGRDEIRHPDTGVVLVPATPGLGERLATMEDTLNNLSDTRAEMAALNSRVDSLATSFETHVTDSAKAEQSRSEEAKAMWDAIKAVAEAEPPQWDGADRRRT